MTSANLGPFINYAFMPLGAHGPRPPYVFTSDGK